MPQPLPLDPAAFDPAPRVPLVRPAHPPPPPPAAAPQLPGALVLPAALCGAALRPFAFVLDHLLLGLAPLAALLGLNGRARR